MKNLVILVSFILAIGCQPNQTQQQASAPAGDEMKTSAAPAGDEMKTSAVNEDFKNLFEEVNVVKMHLFASHEANPNPDNYPYVGKPITGNMTQYLPPDAQANGTGGVFACYRTENSGHYILRIPGKDASSDLVLCKWDGAAGKLKKVAYLAFLQCENGTCYQQDSWLADLDDNRLLELIVRSQKRDSKGMISDETFDVITDDGTGSFTKSNEQLASLAVKSNYVMQ
ncbi:MAG: hypothetical protein H6577_25345 [Lewinellaceae bacterium]|nr:hypothetical protein [Lewinellaceae bacterium]